MKLSPFAATVFLFSLSTASAQSTHDYLGTNVTLDDGNVAICGTNIGGCINVPSHNSGARCGKNGVSISGVENLGADPQQWVYEQGLLKPKNQEQSWHQNYERCLGVGGKHHSSRHHHNHRRQLGGHGHRHHSSSFSSSDSSTSHDYEERDTFRLSLMRCPSEGETAREKRFIFTEDGRVQSLGAFGTTSESYCMTIDSGSVSDAAGSTIVLQECADSELEEEMFQQQAFQLLGDASPFFHSLQENWGQEDTVELAYQLPAGSNGATLSIYNQANEVVHTVQVENTSGVISLDVVELDLDQGSYTAMWKTSESEDDATTDYVTSFSIVDEPHVSCGNGSTYTSFSSISNPANLMVISLITLAILASLCCLWKRYDGNSRNVSTDDDATVLDVDDDMALAAKQADPVKNLDSKIDGPSNHHDDETEVASLATSNDDQEMSGELKV